MFRRNESIPTLKKDAYSNKILILSSVIVGIILAGASFLYKLGYLDMVKDSLSKQVGVNADNYPLVFIYIVLINGPLEEFFFRHFSNHNQIKYRYFISSLLFSLYHVGMLYTMFPWYIFLAAIFSLIIVGYFFIKINTLQNSILNSIIIHMAANLAINLVGWFIIMN